ncbi:DJ-1/PfpI family protein [Nannocystis punicea]|uniref:DJ-1/PfpI family protein n=1 Tax=Nannocystis punicea TaxID=2995304 RepID=A0ABY7GS26_9BACT|nr:DJ-1/PfpI family protein [Nannocystis poenicansa]WAS89760.1 DJ-1/PfpI family protein [Nannocystis poenicansa]
MTEHDFLKQSFTGLTERRLQVAIFVCPGFAPVDMIGIHTIFGVMPTAEVHLVWKDRSPLLGMPTFPSQATTTFADCPRELDVLHIGAVPPDILDDEESLAFLADHGQRARYVTANCGGSVILGAAGLLRGYRATSNFHVVDMLALFGAIPTKGGAIVEDRNRITAGPATGNFEVGLRLLELLCGREVAREMELQIEYAPRPPFGTGSPDLAGPELTRRALERVAPVNDLMRAPVERAAARLRRAP